MITVFTPTYNRGRLLLRLYQSLCKQSYRDFEWIIVDDGSNDDTGEIVGSFHIDDIPIQYVYKPNGGKHTAINLGVKEAKGELFFIADSDDILPFDSLEKVAKYYGGIKEDPSYGGVCGLDATFEGKMIGSGLPVDTIDGTSLDIRFIHGITGDMKEVFKTSVLREFPFPEIIGERFCPEVLIWNRIASKYRLRYFNQIIYNVEYQDGGLTSSIVSVRMGSPINTTTTYAEMTSYNIPIRAKIRAAINYWRFRFCPKRQTAQQFPRIGKSWYIFAPIGLVLHFKDLRVCK